MHIPDVNPETIADEAMRTLVIQLLNGIETLLAENAALRVENQQLRDELARLKGGSGKPDIKPSVKPVSSDYSSEAERRTRTPRGKPKKDETLTVTREERCTIDPATLPPDAERKDMVETIVQHLHIEVEVIRFIREVWYSKSKNKTFTAPLPPGYHGKFSPTAYHAQTEVQVVPILLSDDAAVYDRVTTTHALC